MNDQTDSQLLCAYAESHSETAFTELVRRHVDFVYSAALRMVCDSHLAQDVTQSVFVALAKSAGQLTQRSVLSGWLHRTAQNIAAQTVRTIERRRAREQEATVMNELLAAEPNAVWENISPYLDAALGELSEPDRDALLLRYFERKSAREMAQTLGISDEAAQKRVTRAVERLREFFSKRGVTVGTSGLAVVISANAVQVAPVGLAVTISTAAALTGTTIAVTTTATVTKAIAMTALQKTIVTATIAVLAGAGIYEARRASQLREQVQTLQQQQAPLDAQLNLLQNEFSDATNRLAGIREENERLNWNSSELLKLRGEVGRLRRHNVELERLWAGLAASTNTSTEMENPISTESVSQESWRFAGYGSPENTVLSLAWTETQGDFEKMLAGGTSEWQEQVRRQYERGAESTGKSPEEVFADDVEAMKRIKAFRIVKSENLSDDQVLLHVRTEGLPVQMVMILKKIDNEWKIVSHHQY